MRIVSSAHCVDRRSQHWDVVGTIWIADKELKLSYYNKETLLPDTYICIYTHNMVASCKALNSNSVIESMGIQPLEVPLLDFLKGSWRDLLAT